jgi:hypothetical protein
VVVLAPVVVLAAGVVLAALPVSAAGTAGALAVEVQVPHFEGEQRSFSPGDLIR